MLKVQKERGKKSGVEDEVILRGRMDECLKYEAL